MHIFECARAECATYDLQCRWRRQRLSPKIMHSNGKRKFYNCYHKIQLPATNTCKAFTARTYTCIHIHMYACVGLHTITLLCACVRVCVCCGGGKPAKSRANP